jgi:hypothetical protein
LLAFEPWLGGRLTEAPADAEAVEIGCITAWKPAARLAFTRQAGFAPDRVTQVEVRFEPIGSQMCVTVEHRGWESVPQGHVARYGFPMRLSCNHMANGSRRFCLASSSGGVVTHIFGHSWLPFLDTYRTMCLVPQPEFQQLLNGIRGMRLAA